MTTTCIKPIFFFTWKIVLHWADNVKSVEIIQRIHQKIETICKKSMNFFVPNHRFWYFKLMSEKTKPNESPVFKINQLLWQITFLDPSTLFWKKYFFLWHLTPDTLQMIYDTQHKINDTQGGGVKIVKKFQVPGLNSLDVVMLCDT